MNKSISATNLVIIKTIFISRELAVDSPFLEELVPKGYQVYGESLLAFSAVPFEVLPESDWLFFYSPKSVEFSLKNEQLRQAIKVRRLAAMGKGTAALLQKKGYLVDYIGTGKAETTAAAFALLAKDQKVLFPRAKNSRRSVQLALGRLIDTLDLVLYTNNIKSEIEVPKVDILVFTSPMNALAYFKTYSVQADQKVIAIGETTAQQLQKLGVESPYIPKESHENALVDLIKQL